jgi:hypothetical protein
VVIRRSRSDDDGVQRKQSSFGAHLARDDHLQQGPGGESFARQRASAACPYVPSRETETNNEFNQLIQLINTMAGIEPTEAFRNFEPVIDQSQSAHEAWAVVSAFKVETSVKANTCDERIQLRHLHRSIDLQHFSEKRFSTAPRR